MFVSIVVCACSQHALSFKILFFRSFVTVTKAIFSNVQFLTDPVTQTSLPSLQTSHFLNLTSNFSSFQLCKLVHAWLCPCIYMYTYIHIYIHMCVNMHIYLCDCVCLCVYTCVCIYTYMWIHTLIVLYTHRYIFSHEICLSTCCVSLFVVVCDVLYITSPGPSPKV